MRESPPPVPGTLAARLLDVPRVSWWLWRGFVFGVRRAESSVGLVVAVVLLVLGSLVGPVVLPLYCLYTFFAPGRRTYVSPDRMAVLTLIARPGGVWEAENHVCARPGHGSAAALRQRVFGHLLPLADVAGIELKATAASARLAAIYCAEVPGLVDVGRAFPRGQRLRRLGRGPTDVETARVQQLVDEVAAEVGVAPLEVKLTAAAEPFMGIYDPLAKTPKLRVSLLTVRQGSDRALRWAIAHECAHVAYGDLSIRDAAGAATRLLGRTLGGFTLGIAAWVAAVVALAYVVTVPDWLLWTSMTALCLALVTGAVRWGHLVADSRRSAARSRRNELRCDLVATRAYGVEAGVEALAQLVERDRRHAAAGRSGRYATHPPADVRVAAVSAYDVTLAPEVEAPRLLISISRTAPARLGD